MHEEYAEFAHLYYLKSVPVVESSSPEDTHYHFHDGSSYSGESDCSQQLEEQAPLHIDRVTIDNLLNQSHDCGSALNVSTEEPGLHPALINANITLGNATVNLENSPELFNDSDSDDSDSEPELQFAAEPLQFSQVAIALAATVVTDRSQQSESRPQQYNKHQPCSQEAVLDRDARMLRSIGHCMGGVLPPPSVTTTKITVDQMLERLKQNAAMLDLSDVGGRSHGSDGNCGDAAVSSILNNTDVHTVLNCAWPQVLELRHIGLSYNRNQFSEDTESLIMRYMQRFVGAETQTTCSVFTASDFMSSPAKRRQNQLRWNVKSPGKRLSHLARRRTTFSSSNLLQTVGASSSRAAIVGPGRNRQILVDTKRKDNATKRRTTPSKKTPRKSPRKRMRTPSSSGSRAYRAKVRLLETFSSSTSSHANLNGVLASNSNSKATKRALFQSPEKATASSSVATTLPKPSVTNSSLSPWKRRNTPRQALFASPDKRGHFTGNSVVVTNNDDCFASPHKAGSSMPTVDTRKRKRLDSDTNDFMSLPRTMSLDTGRLANSAAESSSLKRIRSEEISNGGSAPLSAHHKKKLQWAVSEALRTQSIGVRDANFKQFASTLARVTRKFLPDLSVKAPRPEGGTSDRMLRIARQHVYAVVKCKSFEEIVATSVECQRLKQPLKPMGYVSKEDAQKLHAPPTAATSTMMRNPLKDKENVIHDSIGSAAKSSARDKFSIPSSIERLHLPSSVEKYGGGVHSVSSTSSSGLSRDQLIRSKLGSSASKLDAVRKVINFDGDIR